LPEDWLADYGTIKKLVLLLYAFDSGTSTRIKQRELAARAGVSQQTVSRVLRELERGGFLERRVGGRGEYLSLTEKGLVNLAALLDRVSRIVQGPRKVVLRGRVISGLGEGGFYVSLSHYSSKIQEFLGERPYPGTLNVALQPDTQYSRPLLEKLATFVIPGFSDGKRTYGSAKLVPCRVNGFSRCAIIIPSRTHHPPNVIEVVAPVYLRGELGLKDGDEVIIEIPGGESEP